jgi:hypothetical protein
MTETVQTQSEIDRLRLLAHSLGWEILSSITESGIIKIILTKKIGT